MRQILIILFCLAWPCFPNTSVRAQELQEEAAPFTAWLDFNRRALESWPKTGLPIWMESVSASNQIVQGQAKTTTFRIRLQKLRELDNQMELRLFFEDAADAEPSVVGWSEIGTQIFARGPLGQGLGLSTSETLTFTTRNLDFIEVTVPGDGHGIRGALLELLEATEMQRSVDFLGSTSLIEAFERSAPLVNPKNDMALFGRIRATLDREAVKLTAQESPTAGWEFELTSLPLLVVVSFEILGADVQAPVELIVNDRPLGAVMLGLPDLADPAYVGLVRPLETGMRFRYSGWLRAQKVIPASSLQMGVNRLILKLPSDAGSVGIRALELQLKHNWKNLDYQLAPTKP
jgi:hypothetical protein